MQAVATAHMRGTDQTYLTLSAVYGFASTDDGLWRRFVDHLHVDQSGCILWTAALTTYGYGQVYYQGRPRKAHRMAWLLSHGTPAPDDLMVLHTCDVRSCVNPDHLFLGDAYANHRDMTRKGRARVGIGSRHGNARLTETRVRAIRLLLDDGITPAPIARCLDVSIQTICRIRDGFSWLHVQEGDPAA